ERAQLIDHAVDGFLQLQDLAAHVDRDLARQVAVGDRNGDFGDVAHLAGQVAGHGIDAVGQVLPGTGHAGHRRLTAEFAFRADLARHARYLGSEGAHLLDDRIHDGRGAQELALERAAVHLETHGLLQVALGDGRDGACHFGRGPQQIVDQGVDRALHGTPCARSTVDRHAMAGATFLAYVLSRALELARQALIGSDNLVKGVGYLAGKARMVARESHREIAIAHCLQRAQELAQVERGIGRPRAVVLAGATFTFLYLHQRTPAQRLPFDAALETGNDRRPNAPLPDSHPDRPDGRCRPGRQVRIVCTSPRAIPASGMVSQEQPRPWARLPAD